MVVHLVERKVAPRDVMKAPMRAAKWESHWAVKTAGSKAGSKAVRTVEAKGGLREKCLAGRSANEKVLKSAKHWASH